MDTRLESNIQYPKSINDLTVDTLHQMAAAYIEKYGDPAIVPKKHWYSFCCRANPQAEHQRQSALWLKNLTAAEFDRKDAWFKLADIFSKEYTDVDIVYHPPRSPERMKRDPIYIHRTTFLAGVIEQFFKNIFHDTFDGPGYNAYTKMLSYLRSVYPPNRMDMSAA